MRIANVFDNISFLLIHVDEDDLHIIYSSIIIISCLYKYLASRKC